MDTRPSLEGTGGAAAGIYPQPPAAVAKSAPWGAVILLMVVSMMNILDRTLPAVLGELIKRDLALSDTVLGLVNGFGFLIVYAVAALPVARLADRKGYGIIISVCMAIWSVMTMAGGVVQAGWQLALTRTGVALGEAGTMPASQAFIANEFPSDRRARPMAVLSLSAPLSIFGAMTIGGLLGQTIGWRATFIVMGVTSLIISPFVRVVLGRRKIGDVAVEREPLSAVLAVFLAKASFRWIMVASALVGIGSYSLTAFNAPFLMRFHDFTVAQVGLRYGLILAVVGSFTLVAIGGVIDRLTRRDPRWTLWLLAMLFGGMVPFAILSLSIGNRDVSLVLMAIAGCAGIGYLVPTIVAVHRLSPPHLRGTASALILLGVSLTGGFGPLVVGVISDALEPSLGTASLGRALLVVPIAFGGAAIAFMAATRSYRGDLVDEPA